MKTTPTELDREAAGLFKTAPGVRAWRTFGHDWVRIMNEDWCAVDVYDAWVSDYAVAHLSALDTDDPATMGCMLAQVEEAEEFGDSCVWMEPDTDVSGVANGRWLVKRLDGFGGVEMLADEVSKSAAIVSAMRSLKPG